MNFFAAIGPPFLHRIHPYIPYVTHCNDQARMGDGAGVGRARVCVGTPRWRSGKDKGVDREVHTLIRRS